MPGGGVAPDPDSTPVIDAKAYLWRAEPAGSAGHPVFFEELHLHVGGQAASHLASIVGPFVLADLPVVMWFPDVLPDPTDPLLRLATALVVDTRLVAPGSAAMGHSYRTLLELANHQPVVDLSWVRLQPWRELLAGLFEPEHSRRFLQGVRSAPVTGKPGPRHILGGWLMAQLDLRARELVLTDSKHVDMTLEASYHGEEGKFQVERDGGARAVWANASLSSGMSHSQALPLPDDSLTSALSAAISNLRADRVWERALAAAAALGVLTVRVLPVNREMVVTDDLPGAFAREVISAFVQRPGEEFDIALSGGETARACYERLAVDGAQEIDWLVVNFFWGTSCCVPPNHPDSNELLGRQALLERVGAANAVYPMRCDEGLDAYQLRLGEIGQLDIVHLGLGADGHTAGLFPGSKALDADPGQLVTFSEDPNGADQTPADDAHLRRHRQSQVGHFHRCRGGPSDRYGGSGGRRGFARRPRPGRARPLAGQPRTPPPGQPVSN